MDDTKKNTKLVIAREDELTDIVSGILESPSERIIITFAEESDLLISPINLSVLQETADEEEKLLITQIIKNPTGFRNSTQAGVVTTDSPNNPTEEMWVEAEEKRAIRLNPKPKEKVEEKKEQEIGENTPSTFEKRVNDAIQKSREGIASRPLKETEKDGVFLSLDEDLPATDIEQINDEEIKVEDIPKEEQTATNHQTQPKKSFSLPSFDLKKLWPFKKTLPGENIKSGTRIKRFLPIIILSLVLVSALVSFIYIKTVPFVKVAIYVEAKEVSIEKIFTGDENIKEIDFENLRIPLKELSVEKDRSSSIKATGVAYKGEKASGEVNLIYNKVGCTEPASLPAGHIISTSGKAYTLDSATSIPCNGLASATVHAREIGSEYNIESNQSFTVQGYSSELFGLNNAAFTGGTKQEYTVLSQKDVDSGVEDLKTAALQESDEELKNNTQGWEIINDSLVGDIVKDSLKTSVAVGSAAGDVDLDVKVKSSAKYYLTEGFDAGISELLTKEAQEKNLFESENNIALSLANPIEKTISVVEDNKNGVKIKLIAKGNISPSVNKEEIVNTLKNLKWDAGLEYLQTLNFSEKRSSASFFPKNFLSKYPYFPKRQGGVLIEVHNI